VSNPFPDFGTGGWGKLETRRQKLEIERQGQNPHRSKDRPLRRERSTRKERAGRRPAFPGTHGKGLGVVVVEFFFVGVAEAGVEEAFVAGLAAIGAAEQEVVKEPLDRTISSGAVDIISTAIRAKRGMLLTGDFDHGDFLAGRP